MGEEVEDEHVEENWRAVNCFCPCRLITELERSIRWQILFPIEVLSEILLCLLWDTVLNLLQDNFGRYALCSLSFYVSVCSQVARYSRFVTLFIICIRFYWWWSAGFCILVLALPSSLECCSCSSLQYLRVLCASQVFILPPIVNHLAWKWKRQFSCRINYDLRIIF